MMNSICNQIHIAVVLGLITISMWSLNISHITLLPFMLALSLFCAVLNNNDELEELRASEERCRTLSETARVYMHHFLPDGTITYMNKFAEDISGYSREEVIGKSFLDVFVPEYRRDKVKQSLKPMLAGEPVINYESPLLTKSGEERIMLWSGARMVGPNGEVIGVVASGIDITELKRVQTALQDSENLYRSLVDNTPSGITLTTEHEVLFANKRIQEITGYSADELLSIDPYTLIHPDDVDRVYEAIAHLMRDEPAPQPLEYRLITKSDEIRNVEGRGVIISYKEKPTILSSIIDVTEFKKIQDELRQSEFMYRTLFNHSLAGIFIVQGTRITFANKRAEEITGYTIEEARELDFWHLVHPDYQELIKDRAMRRLRGENVPERYEYILVTKSGEARWAEILTTLIDFQGGKAILANIIDITERRKAEETRLEAEKELERHKRQFYKQAILALTYGKLVVLEPAETESVIINPQITVEICEPKDVSLSRHLIREFSTTNGLTGDRLDEFMLAVGEATMNAIKHTGAGIVYAGLKQEVIWVGVKDRGSGMDTLVLTQAVLRKGFSTQPSLGLGYTFILSGSDRVLLSTSPQGTTVVMEKRIVEAKSDMPIDISRIPDLWEKIPSNK